jgi:hypothetical protein
MAKKPTTAPTTTAPTTTAPTTTAPTTTAKRARRVPTAAVFTTPVMAPVTAPISDTPKGVTLSAETIKAVHSTINDDAKVAKRWKHAADLLRVDGVTSESLSSDRAYYMKALVYPTFSPDMLAAYTAPPKGLSDIQKAMREIVRTESASRFGKIARHIKTAEQEETMTDETTGARHAKKTIGQTLAPILDAWIKKVENAEAVDFSATEMLKYLKSARVLIKS